MDSATSLHGLMAEFEEPEQLIDAARKAREAGYREFDAYTPFPLPGLHEAMGRPRTILPWLVLLGGILGGLTGYGLQYYAHVIDYPLNVGGRPFHTWPSFIVVTFELTILGAAATAVFGMLALNGFPMPYHPVFNVEEFARASQDRFFLCIESKDPRFVTEKTRAFLEELGPVQVHACAP